MVLNCNFLMDNVTELLSFACNSWNFENTGLFSLKLFLLSSFFCHQRIKQEERGKKRAKEEYREVQVKLRSICGVILESIIQ